jgi:hypothetical protein
MVAGDYEQGNATVQNQNRNAISNQAHVNGEVGGSHHLEIASSELNQQQQAIVQTIKNLPPHPHDLMSPFTKKLLMQKLIEVQE